MVSPLLFAGAPAEPRLAIPAATCSAADVQTALDLAPDGSTVLIPAGDCDWGATQVARDAGVTIEGAGSELTTIRRTAPVTDFLYALLELDCANGKTVDVSGIAMVGNDELQTEAERLLDKDVGLSLVNGCRDFQVHDSSFSKFSHAGVSIEGHAARGVIFQSSFVSNFKCQVPAVSCLGYGVMVIGDPDHRRPPLALGTRNAVFVEDSTFYDNRHAIASNYGSRYVVRHNTFVSTARTSAYGMVDAHGRSEGRAGSRSWEVYENVLRTNPPSVVAAGIFIRGGDGVVFDNEFSQIPHVLQLRNERCPADGHYPLADQTTEAHVWGNEWEPVSGYDDAPIWVAKRCKQYLVEGRDFFAFARPEYVPYAFPHPLRG